MNHIYLDVNHISMLTDDLGASAHSHGMIQFFLALDNRPDIKVGRKKLERPVCLFVQKSPDIFFKEHKQTWNVVKDFAYVHYGRKVMNRNVSRIRQLAG